MHAKRRLWPRRRGTSKSNAPQLRGYKHQALPLHNGQLLRHGLLNWLRSRDRPMRADCSQRVLNVLG